MKKFRSERCRCTGVTYAGFFVLFLSVFLCFYSVTAESSDISERRAQDSAQDIVRMVEEIDSYRKIHKKNDWALDVTDVAKKYLGEPRGKDEAIALLINSGFSIFYNKNGDKIIAKLSKKTVLGLWIFGDVIEIYLKYDKKYAYLEKARVVYEHL